MNNPEDASAGTRKVPFARELYIERDDFMEEPAKKFFRLSPGRDILASLAPLKRGQTVVAFAAEMVERTRPT